MDAPSAPRAPAGERIAPTRAPGGSSPTGVLISVALHVLLLAWILHETATPFPAGENAPAVELELVYETEPTAVAGAADTPREATEDPVRAPAPPDAEIGLEPPGLPAAVDAAMIRAEPPEPSAIPLPDPPPVEIAADPTPAERQAALSEPPAETSEPAPETASAPAEAAASPTAPAPAPRQATRLSPPSPSDAAVAPLRTPRSASRTTPQPRPQSQTSAAKRDRAPLPAAPPARVAARPPPAAAIPQPAAAQPTLSRTRGSERRRMPPDASPPARVAARAAPDAAATPRSAAERSPPPTGADTRRPGRGERATRPEPGPAPAQGGADRPAAPRADPVRATPSRAPERSAPARAVEAESSPGSASGAAYGSLVNAELNRRKRYPAIAQAMGVEGSVGVSFTIGAGGRIVSHAITRSSGHASLDESVRSLMASVAFPPPPGGAFPYATSIRFRLE